MMMVVVAVLLMMRAPGQIPPAMMNDHRPGFTRQSSAADDAFVYTFSFFFLVSALSAYLHHATCNFQILLLHLLQPASLSLSLSLSGWPCSCSERSMKSERVCVMLVFRVRAPSWPRLLVK